jgi:hypothetical protein
METAKGAIGPRLPFAMQTTRKTQDCERPAPLWALPATASASFGPTVVAVEVSRRRPAEAVEIVSLAFQRFLEVAF